MNITRTFPRDAESVPTARHFVTSVVADVPKDIADRAALIVSELASNAIRHAGTDFVVNVEKTSEVISVEIIDTGGGEPKLRFAQPSDPSGRGLRIVETLADNWGVRPATTGPGKTVWFTLSLSSAEPSTLCPK